MRRKVHTNAYYNFVKSYKIPQNSIGFAARLPLKFYEIYRTIAVLVPCILSRRARAAKFYKILATQSGEILLKFHKIAL